MDSNNSVRQIDELGRIVLPIELRQALDWGEKVSVELQLDQEKGELILRRHAAACIYCGSARGLIEFQKKHVCTSCVNELRRL